MLSVSKVCCDNNRASFPPAYPEEIIFPGDAAEILVYDVISCGFCPPAPFPHLLPFPVSTLNATHAFRLPPLPHVCVCLQVQQAFGGCRLIVVAAAVVLLCRW